MGRSKYSSGHSQRSGLMGTFCFLALEGGAAAFGAHAHERVQVFFVGPEEGGAGVHLGAVIVVELASACGGVFEVAVGVDFFPSRHRSMRSGQRSIAGKPSRSSRACSRARGRWHRGAGPSPGGRCWCAGAGLEQHTFEPGARAFSRWRADSICESFCRSSQTMSVGRLARRRRPRMRWPVPKASMVTPLGRRMAFGTRLRFQVQV